MHVDGGAVDGRGDRAYRRELDETSAPGRGPCPDRDAAIQANASNQSKTFSSTSDGIPGSGGRSPRRPPLRRAAGPKAQRLVPPERNSLALARLNRTCRTRRSYRNRSSHIPRRLYVEHKAGTTSRSCTPFRRRRHRLPDIDVAKIELACGRHRRLQGPGYC